jgi:CheY-like chemotaxis protein
VLVVEANPVNQLVASGMLDALGYKVEIANNGAEALEEVRKRSFDIVLTLPEPGCPQFPDHTPTA